MRGNVPTPIAANFPLPFPNSAGGIKYASRSSMHDTYPGHAVDLCDAFSRRSQLHSKFMVS